MKEQGISKRAAMVAALLLFSGAGAGLYYKSQQRAPQSENRFKRDRLEIVTARGKRSLEIELAETPDQHRQGLMFRTALAENAGMLFLYEKPDEVRMWMKNTFIPLDMVFIRSDGTIHRIEAHTEPHSERVIESSGPVTAVLEIAGGTAERLGLKPGDKVIHPHFKP
jgi:hypothetical protein